MSPKERYEELLAEAAEFEKMAGDDTSAGPSYWDDKEKSTRNAIADAAWQPNRDNVGFVHSISATAASAVHSAFDTGIMKQVWLRAAAICRNRANGMRERLEKQRDELNELLDGLE